MHDLAFPASESPKKPKGATTMRATLTVKMDSAAFEESASAELARILRDAAEHVIMADLNEQFDRHYMLRDLNGNTVGSLKVSQ